MKFNSDFKPWLVASGDEIMIHLVNLKLEVEKKRLVATNGHILLIVPVEVSKADKTGLLTQDTVKWAVEHPEDRGEAEIDCSSAEVAVVGDVTFKRPAETNENKFPPADSVLPSFGEVATHVFAFDAAYLIRLANAMGAGSPRTTNPAMVRITVKAEDKMLDVIKVEKLNDDQGAVGLLMPCRS